MVAKFPFRSMIGNAFGISIKLDPVSEAGIIIYDCLGTSEASN